LIADTIKAEAAEPADVATNRLGADPIIGSVLNHCRLTDALILRLCYLDSLTMEKIAAMFDCSES
jgi:DNA-directed RNA polymerase specialized sigma24 family protein